MENTEDCNCPACRAARGENPNPPISLEEAQELRDRVAELTSELFQLITAKLPGSVIYLLGYVQCNLVNEDGSTSSATLDSVKSQLFEHGVPGVLGHLEMKKHEILNGAAAPRPGAMFALVERLLGSGDDGNRSH